MSPRIWVLIGEKTGDNNQVLALAEQLGKPFETRSLRYNLARAIPPRFLGPTLATLTRASRRWIRPPWPDLVLAIGRRSVPVARWIRQASGHRSKLVLVGHPRVDPEHFDLVVTTHQYPVPKRGNVVVLPMGMSRARGGPEPTPEEAAWAEGLPRPHLLLALGGPTKYWDLATGAIVDSARRLRERAEASGGSLVVVGSRRTPADLLQAIRSKLDGDRHMMIEGRFPSFPFLMADADEIFVTADSIAMLSEAIQADKPVGMVEIQLSPRGRRLLGEHGEKAHRRRDLRKVWATLHDSGLVGTIDQPGAGQAAQPPVEIAAAAVRPLLESGGER